ncbi:MAG: putative cupin superfamily protein [Rhodothermales bacterium]|jgi:uncharacterized cupin superfamily protein
MSDDDSSRPFLVKAADIAEMPDLAKSHFLNPKAQRVNKLLGDGDGLTGFGFHIITVEPGQLTTEHYVHHHEDECVSVLEGEAVALIGDEEYPIGPGGFIACRKGACPSLSLIPERPCSAA